MIIKDKKMFAVGALFAVSFLAVLVVIFSPGFDGKTGLEYADDMFNRLSKGSSYFIPKTEKAVKAFDGTPFSVKIKMEGRTDAERAAKLLVAAGARVEQSDTALSVEGDLGAVLRVALKDSDAMYKNDGKAVAVRYGYGEKEVMKDWWQALAKIEKTMKKEKKIEQAKVVSDVNKKAVEPSYNFYGIEGQKVVDHAGMMSGLLVFYVLYTMWWGYAIFYMFDGLGLSMKKAKIRKEA